MRIRLAPLVACLLIWALAEPALAEEDHACTVTETNETPNGRATYEKVCWLIGSDGTYTVTVTEPPVLYPQIGSNPDGSECWYWTTAVTQWVIIARDGSSATIGEDVGVGIVLDTTVGACAGIPGEDLRSVAWDYLKTWLLAEPSVELNPAAVGFTGLETYVWAPLPDRIDATLTSPAGTALQARAWIDQVVVDWGDTTSSPLVLNESQLGRFSPYPDGSAYHVYETKTCNEEGQSRCFADVDGYPLTVSFRWQAAYRVGTNPWIDIGPVVPSATLAYPVDEIVARIETTG